MIDVYLFGETHPYGRFSRQEDFDQLTREDLVAFYERQYKNGGFKIFIAGKLPENIDRLLDTWFGDLLNGKSVDQPFAIHPAEQKKYQVINDEKITRAPYALPVPL